MKLNQFSHRALPFLALIFLAWSSGDQAVSLQAGKKNGKIAFELAVKPGFGIQKEGPHKIRVMQLLPGHEKIADIKEKLQSFAMEKEVIQKLSGQTAAEDDKYFSAITPFSSEKAHSGELAIEARIYYCSFASKFCSVQVIRQLVK